MQRGLVFDIREFTVHDGPGLRVTVFLKGCPLRCSWCHNPEGLAPQPQWMRSPAGQRLVGAQFTSAELAARLNGQADLLRAAEGGVTFSGGEPLAQAAFVAEVIDQLDGLHVVLDTSGYAEEADFQLVASKAHLVYFDLKLMDPQEHLRHTGAGNEPILRNFRILCELAVPFVIRIPLVPGVTDTDANLEAVAACVRGKSGLQRLDLLPYNPAAGAKHAACGLEFRPTFDEARPLNPNTDCFKAAGLTVRIA